MGAMLLRPMWIIRACFSRDDGKLYYYGPRLPLTELFLVAFKTSSSPPRPSFFLFSSCHDRLIAWTALCIPIFFFFGCLCSVYLLFVLAYTFPACRTGIYRATNRRCTAPLLQAACYCYRLM